ncbi:MAG: hypothetical protein SFZ23_13755 [Planctomycetota bacterium]|nr:hypothetical protein [Planctomycetota bacterium]
MKSTTRGMPCVDRVVCGERGLERTSILVRRAAAGAALAIAAMFLVACGEASNQSSSSPAESTPSNPDSGAGTSGAGSSATDTAGTPGSSASSTSVDWSRSSVSPADDQRSTDLMFYFGRLADVWYQGAPGTHTWTCDAGGTIRDGKGNSFKIEPGEWLGVMHQARKAASPEGAAIRALPSEVKNYADGLGSHPRHAYFLKFDDQGVATVTYVRPAGGGPSGG